MDADRLRTLVGQRVHVRVASEWGVPGHPGVFPATVIQVGGSVTLVEFPPVPTGLIRDPDDPVPVSDEENEALCQRLCNAEGRVWVSHARIQEMA